MKNDIILAGVGGQGILSIATIIGYAAIDSGLELKQAEVHGMSQRGGDVQSHLRVSDARIYSDLIPKGKADLIISVEPMEALRYMPYLSPEGWMITNTKPFINIPNYPEEARVMTEVAKVPHNVALNADDMAKAVGNPRGMNMVVLGAASPYLCVSYEKLQEGIRAVFGRKGEAIVEANLKCLAAGREFAMEIP